MDRRKMAKTTSWRPDVVRAAEDAVVEVRGMVRFMSSDSSPHVAELVRFYEAVAPLVD